MHFGIFRIVSHFGAAIFAMNRNFRGIRQSDQLAEIMKHRKVDKKPELVGSCLLEILGSDPNSQLLKSLYILEVLSSSLKFGKIGLIHKIGKQICNSLTAELLTCKS